MAFVVYTVVKKIDLGHLELSDMQPILMVKFPYTAD